MHGNRHRNHAIKADVHRVRVGRRYWHFTFSDRWGPMLTDEWGEPIDSTPLADEAHPFWDAFEAWQAREALSKVKGEPPCDHRGAVEHTTGDGAKVEFCPDCGRNVSIGPLPFPEEES